MPNKLQRVRQQKTIVQETITGEPAPESPPGKFIRHPQPLELEAIESQMAVDSKNMSHINGKIALLMMAYRDMKSWLREIESYLNFDARYDGMAFFRKKFDDMEKANHDLSKKVEELEKCLYDALKEE